MRLQTEKSVFRSVESALLFPEQLPREPDVSWLYVDSFDGKGVYHAARRQNSSFYEEGRDRLIMEKTKEGISQALEKL